MHLKFAMVTAALLAGLTACQSDRSPPRALNATAPANPAPAPPGASLRQTASAGAISPSNPSTAIVDVNRSVPQPLGANSPPPTTFENSCAPAPYVFQSIAGYEAARVKDCRNDQLLYLPTSAQTLIDTYLQECSRRCGGA